MERNNTMTMILINRQKPGLSRKDVEESETSPEVTPHEKSPDSIVNIEISSNDQISYEVGRPLGILECFSSRFLSDDDM